jgi:1-piperideine-2-carboxylate/1-pyrroline-2-carboxylate reductase [NAD(P)H]
LIQARVDWTKVAGIAAALAAAPGTPAAVDYTARVFKTVGCAAWDLAAGRVARNLLRTG